MLELPSAHSQSLAESSAVDPILPRVHGSPGQLIRANEARSQSQIGPGFNSSTRLSRGRLRAGSV